jgi:hypothetical protein
MNPWKGLKPVVYLILRLDANLVGMEMNPWKGLKQVCPSQVCPCQVVGMEMNPWKEGWNGLRLYVIRS